MQAGTAEAELWDYSLRVYGLPGVADCCVSLQDRYGCDVNLLLICLWLAETRCVVLATSDLQTLRSFAAAPNENVVRPVRAARRWLKIWSEEAITTGPHALAYQALKEAELQGERLVQFRLIAGLNMDAFERAGTGEAAARVSFSNYFELLSEPANASKELQSLIAAVWPAEPPTQ